MEDARSNAPRDAGDSEAEVGDGGATLSARVLATQSIEVAGYRIEQPLGRGGQGTVYRAMRRSDGLPVAIKLLTDGALASPDAALRFEHEVGILRLLQHPHIVGALDDGRTQNGYRYVVMPFVAGEHLDRALADPKRAAMPLGPRLQLFLRIARAVAAANAAGIVHRDLSPSNILVDDHDEPHLIDFGLARSSLANQAGLTATGTFVGKYRYASPEQTSARAGDIDARADVYALGVILHEMMSGKLPYDLVDDPCRDVLTIRTTAPRRLRLAAGLSADRRTVDGLRAIAARALQKEPWRRYADAGAMAEDLERMLRGQVIAPAGAQRVRGAAWTTVGILAGISTAWVWVGRSPAAAATPGTDATGVRSEPAPPLHILQAAPTAVRAVLVHPDGRTIAAAHQERAGVTAWRLDLGDRPIRELAPGTCFDTFAPDGTVLYSPGSLTVLASGARLPLAHTVDACEARFSADSRRVAPNPGWLADVVRVFCTDDGREIFRAVFPQHHVARVDLSPDGRLVAASGGAPLPGIGLWNVDTGQAIGPVDWMGGAKTQVRFALDSARLCAYQWPTGLVMTWATTDARIVDRYHLRAVPPTNLDSLCATPSGFVILLHRDEPAQVSVWDVAEARVAQTFTLPARPVAPAVLSADGHRVLSAHADHSVHLWTVDRPDRPSVLARGGALATQLAFSPDSTLAVVAFADRTVRVWRCRAP